MWLEKSAVVTAAGQPEGEANPAKSLPLSQQLRLGTMQAHTLVENIGFIRLFLRGLVEPASYVRLLIDLHHLYSRLETNLTRHPRDPLLAPLLIPALWRTRALEADLAYFSGAALGSPSLAARHYGEHLELLGRNCPQLLVAHAYARYLGDLAGGQILRRIASRALDIRGEQGLAFYAFPQIPNVKKFKEEYRARLDSLPVDEELATCIVAEAVRAFELNGNIFESLSGNAWSSLWKLVS